MRVDDLVASKEYQTAGQMEKKTAVYLELWSEFSMVVQKELYMAAQMVE